LECQHVIINQKQPITINHFTTLKQVIRANLYKTLNAQSIKELDWKNEQTGKPPLKITKVDIKQVTGITPSGTKTIYCDLKNIEVKLEKHSDVEHAVTYFQFAKNPK
jgi:hypothetical protein